MVASFIGIKNNNFELIVDSYYFMMHLLVYCFSLYALMKGKELANKKFTYGYSRYETIAAFSVCVFLLLTAFFNLLTTFHIYGEEDFRIDD